jgi:hypothetical protein
VEEELNLREEAVRSYRQVLAFSTPRSAELCKCARKRLKEMGEQ